MIAIALAGFDYLVDMQTSRSGGSEPELFYARAAVLHAARVARIDAFDVAYGNVDDDEGFLREVQIAKQLGFNGKSLVHPQASRSSPSGLRSDAERSGVRAKE